MTDESRRSILPQAGTSGQGSGARLHLPGAGAAFMVGAGLAFAGLGACVKAAGGLLPVEAMVFLRAFFGLLLLLPWMIRGGIASMATRRPWGHIARGLFGVGAMYTFFYALQHLTLAEAVLLSYTTPLFTPLCAWIWLREPLGLRLAVAVLVGFTGVALVLHPEGVSWRPAAWAGLASGALAALAMVAIRALSDSEPPLRVVSYFALVSSLVSLPPVLAGPLDWPWEGVAWMALAAVLATAGQYGVTQAYRHAPAGVVGPFTFATVLFSTALGWGLWGEVPEPMAWFGGAIIVLGGVLALRGRG